MGFFTRKERKIPNDVTAAKKNINNIKDERHIPGSTWIKDEDAIIVGIRVKIPPRKTVKAANHFARKIFCRGKGRENRNSPKPFNFPWENSALQEFIVTAGTKNVAQKGKNSKIFIKLAVPPSKKLPITKK